MVKIGMLEQDILHRTDSGSADSLVIALSYCTILSLRLVCADHSAQSPYAVHKI